MPSAAKTPLHASHQQFNGVERIQALCLLYSLVNGTVIGSRPNQPDLDGLLTPGLSKLVAPIDLSRDHVAVRSLTPA